MIKIPTFKNPSLDILCIIFIFFISRIIFYHFGIRFDASTVENYIQFLDPVELKNNLFKSIFYLHFQPPLFNFFLGLVLKIFPNHYPIAFQIIFLGMGLALYLTIYQLMIKMGIDRIIALILSTLFMISPGVILYENWLFYSYPTALLLCLASLFLIKFVHSNKKSDGFIFFTVLGLLVFLRSIFHLVWFILWLLMLLFNKKSKQVLIFASIPLILILSLCFKNYVLVKSFSTSSTTMSKCLFACTMVLLDSTEEQIMPLYEKGLISKTTLIEFDDMNKIGNWASQHAVLPKYNTPIIDNYTKQSGLVNFNSKYHLYATNQYMDEAIVVLKHYPQNYFKALKRGVMIYFFPGPTDIPFTNREKISVYEDNFNFMFHHINFINKAKLYNYFLWDGFAMEKLEWDWLSRINFFLVISFYAGLLIYGFVKLIKAIKLYPSNYKAFLPLAFILINIIYVSMLCGALASWATNRYRFDVDAFYLILFGLVLNDLRGKFLKNKNEGRLSSH